MACGAKVNSRVAYFQTSSEDDSEYESKPSYKTLAKIATEQQTAMEHIQKLLDKSDDLLDAEMNQTQSLIEDIKSLRLTRRPHQERLMHLLARRWIHRRSLLLRRQSWSLRRSLIQAWQAWI